ncbi:MAG: spermidine/putrescine transport system ATP-binding protein, partial [Gammaproteobacteria bacterium]
LTGVVTHVMYSGTDSQFHIKLDSGDEFIAKLQNSGSAKRDWKSGQKVGVTLQPDSIQILRD